MACISASRKQVLLQGESKRRRIRSGSGGADRFWFRDGVSESIGNSQRWIQL
jgi:hypothetical protein